ncbi:hypothetical protein G6F40_014227 [Rhizopus arrhizus]|nr:hypothetical protein G6F40_014227 [Rhizopus arrhizus]
MIDYFLTNTTSVLRSPRMQVYSDLSLGSAHKLLSLSFDYAVPDGYPSQPVLSSSSARRLWNLSRLKEPDVCSLYSCRQNWSHVFIFCLYTLRTTSFLSL